MGMEHRRIRLEKSGKPKVDHEKDEGVQHPLNNHSDMDGGAVDLCVIKAR